VEVSSTGVYDFSRLFRGNDNSFGQFQPGKQVGDGQKQEGKAWTKTDLISENDYIAHLKGETGLGIVPIRADGTCSFAVIDVDKYDASFNAIIKAIYKYSIPLVPFRSKSGGLHLYLFLDTVVEAKQVLRLMERYRKLFLLDKKTEIFPKQAILKEGEAGNWINLPYYNVENTKQYLIDDDFSSMDIEQALGEIKRKLVSPARLKTVMDELPLFDAPPCLQSLYIQGDTLERNQYLFSLARYYKATKGDDFEFAIMEANNELDNPVKAEELLNTVIKTHKKKNYSYKCKEEPICSICDKNECKSRKYGIGGAEVSDISYEDFIQHGEEDPTYEWVVNGKGLKFSNEADIINQAKFRELCFRELHILPYKITEFGWTEIINTALANVIVKTEEENAGLAMTPAQLFKEHLVEFLTKRAQAATQEQILVDRVWKDLDLQCYVFRAKNLCVFLVQQKQFRAYGIQQISDKLRLLGGVPKMYYIKAKKISTRVWLMPFEGLSKYVDADYQDVAIDFLDDVKKEDY
jgi:hypothetical protein